MKLSEYLKPAIGVVVVIAVGVYYWLGHRPRAEEKEIPANAMVIANGRPPEICPARIATKS